MSFDEDQGLVQAIRILKAAGQLHVIDPEDPRHRPPGLSFLVDPPMNGRHQVTIFLVDQQTMIRLGVQVTDEQLALQLRGVN